MSCTFSWSVIICIYIILRNAGLWTTVALGFVAAATGGRAGICSSASGACAVVVAALCQSHGPSYLSGCGEYTVAKLFGRNSSTC